MSIKSQKLKNESSISQANWSPSQANITFNTSSTVTPQKSKSEALLDVPVYSKYDLETDKAQITQSYERAVTKLQNQFNKEYNNIEYDIACAEIMISRLEAYESYVRTKVFIFVCIKKPFFNFYCPFKCFFSIGLNKNRTKLKIFCCLKILLKFRFNVLYV